MPGADRMRASTRGREATVAVLRDAYAAGRLSLDELQERSGAAYGARTRADLRGLTADLVLPVDSPDRLEVEEQYCVRVWPGRKLKRPFAPMWVMALVWLGIAVAAQAPLAAIIPVPLSVFALWAADWKARSLPPCPGSGLVIAMPWSGLTGGRRALAGGSGSRHACPLPGLGLFPADAAENSPGPARRAVGPGKLGRDNNIVERLIF